MRYLESDTKYTAAEVAAAALPPKYYWRACIRSNKHFLPFLDEKSDKIDEKLIELSVHILSYIYVGIYVFIIVHIVQLYNLVFCRYDCAHCTSGCIKLRDGE